MRVLACAQGASDALEMILNAVYVDRPGQNFTHWLHGRFVAAFPGASPWDPHGVAQLMYVLFKIGFWLVVSGVLHRWRWYWKF